MLLERIAWYWKFIAWEPSMMLQYAVFAAGLLTLYFKVLPGRQNILRLIGWFAAVYGAILTSSIAYHGLVGSNRFSSVIVHGLMIILFATLIGKQKVQSKIIKGAVYYTAELCLVNFAGIFAKLDGTLFYIPEPWSSVIRNLFIVLTLAVAWYLRHLNIGKYKIIPAHTMWLVLAYNCLSLVMDIMHDLLSSDYSTAGCIFAGIAFLSCLGTNLLGYRMACNSCREYLLAVELHAKAIKAESEAEQIQISETRLEELRKIRHDIKNHYAYMKLLLLQGQYDQFNSYFSDLESDVQEQSAIDCGNRTVDAVLNLEQAKVKNAGFEMRTMLAVPQSLPFRDNDICSILANLIDNAVEACARMDLQDAKIDVEIFQKQDYLYIRVCNPVSGENPQKLLSLRTSKNDTIRHGYGSLIVNDIVENYNGSVSRNIRDGHFVVDLMLDMRYHSTKS